MLNKETVNYQNTKSGKVFDYFFQCLILISLILSSIETLPELKGYKSYFKISEIALISFFTIEYFLRIWASNSKRTFIFSFYGLIDLIAILPFYLTLGSVSLGVMRIFRLFRFFRMFKLFRYSKSIQKFQTAFLEIKNELLLFFIATLFIIYLASVGIYHFEYEAQPEVFKSVFHSMWWAVASLTTVGYGDAYPITTGGKIFTFFILMVGLGIVSIPSALFASALNNKNN